MKEHLLSVRMSEKSYARLQRLAVEHGLTMSAMVTYLVNDRFLAMGWTEEAVEEVVEKKERTERELAENQSEPPPNFWEEEQPVIQQKKSRKRHKK